MEPRTKITRLKFLANTSAALMAAFIFIDLGALINVTATKPSIDRNLYVQGVTYDITLGGAVNFEYIVKESYSINKGLSPIALEFAGLSGSKNAVIFGSLDYLSNLPQKTISAWISNRGPSTAPIASKYFAGGGWYWFTLSDGKVRFRQNFATDGQWETTNDVLSAHYGSYVHVAIVYDSSDTANDPVMYVNGSSVAITELSTPAGDIDIEAGEPLILGNLNIAGDALAYNMGASLKDVRIYSRLLSASEIAALAAGEDDYTTVSDGLIFQAPAVKTDKLSDYIGSALTPDMKLIDNVYGLRGTPHYNTSSPDFELWGQDP